MSVTVDGVSVPVRYPTRETRGDVVRVLAELRAQAAMLDRGEMPPAASQERLEADLASVASRLCRDDSLTPEYFTGSPYGVELAAHILAAVEAALASRKGEAASFRDDP